MKKLFLDTETVGLHGLPVLIQYAIEDGPIQLYDIWLHPVQETLELVEQLMQYCFVGFNCSFDMFHLCKLFTIWSLLPPNLIPITNIPMIAETEPLGRDGPCLKPASALDLMLHSRKGPYQCLMARDDIRIRRVPIKLAGPLAQELERRVELDGILFAGRATDGPKWSVLDRRTPEGELDLLFKDVVLKFNPAGGLKYLAQYALGLETEFKSFKDVEVITPTKLVEVGYVPFALGIASPDSNWEVRNKEGKLKGQAWPALVHYHIKHWATNEDARRYAEDDVKYTRLLYDHFDCPDSGDDDSVLACMVGAVRWHGFVIDTGKIEKELKRAQAILDRSPVEINKPREVRRYIRECMMDVEALLIDESTKKANLETIRDEMVVEDEPEACIQCLGDGCPRCDGKGELPVGPMPASVRAAKVLEVKTAYKEVELYAKLLQAGRFHASFNIIGTLSSRMSGGDGLNAQGIKKAAYVRKSFPLAWEGMQLCGGDFDSFEVTLADAVFNDVKLREALERGQKIHALMGVALYPGKTYEDIINSSGTEFNMYTRGKQAIFALLYGGDASTVHNKLSIPLPVAEKAFEDFQTEYSGIKNSREEVFQLFTAMKQPNGIGSVIYWTDPADFAETFLGFRRYFTLENKICKALFTLAQHLPENWLALEDTIVRSGDREQRIGGAVCSALYGAAFQLQAGNKRAANNHLIQSPGAQITKAMQRKIWDHQPAGVNKWIVAPFNVHDEVLVVTDPEYVDAVSKTVKETVESYRHLVPLIGLEWDKKKLNWAESDPFTEKVHVKPPVSEKVIDALEDATDESEAENEIAAEYEVYEDA